MARKQTEKGDHQQLNLNRKHRIRLVSVWFGAICLTCCSCGGGFRSGVSTTTVPSPVVAIDSAVSCPIFDRDSLYAVLVARLGAETHYAPVIRFLVDSLVPQYNFYELENHSEYLFAEPLRFLTRMELDEGRSLVTLTEGASGESHYLLLDASDLIVSHQYLDLYRTLILKREFKDWDGDGKKEIVEVRENIVSGFVGTKEYVFSIGEKGLELRFCIALSEANFGIDSLGGYLTLRSYERLGSELYRIIEQKSRCDEDGNSRGERSIAQYTISADSLITLYDGGEN